MPAATRILANVQLAPDISTNDANYVAQLIQNAMSYAAVFCVLDEFPDDRNGAVEGGPSATTNLTALAINTLLVSVDSSTYEEVALTLASCTTGTLTAAELQVQIRAVDTAFPWPHVTATYSATEGRYTITSPTASATSQVHCSYNDGEEFVAYALKVAPEFGARAITGATYHPAFERIVAQMVINAYRRIKLAPSDYDTATDRAAQLNSAFWAEDEMVKRLLLPLRRIVI